MVTKGLSGQFYMLTDAETDTDAKRFKIQNFCATCYKPADNRLINFPLVEIVDFQI